MSDNFAVISMAEAGDEEVSADIVPASDFQAIMAMSRAEVDMQVATARRFPRSITDFQKTAFELATLDRETAESMYYSLPRKDENGKRTFVEGPSVRFAEVIAYAWGNLRFEGRIVDIGKEFITAQGVTWDLERNNGSRIEVKRRIVTKNGRRYSADMIQTTGNAAVSIALRNSIFDCIPFALAKKVYDAALKTASGESASMDDRRIKAMAFFKEKGVKEEEVYDLLGIRGVADLTTSHIRHLIGLQNAIANGDATLDSVLREVRGNGASEGASELNAALKAQSPVPPPSTEPVGKPVASGASIKRLRELMGLVTGIQGEDAKAMGAAIIAKDAEHVLRWISELESQLVGQA